MRISRSTLFSFIRAGRLLSYGSDHEGSSEKFLELFRHRRHEAGDAQSQAKVAYPHIRPVRTWDLYSVE